MHLEEIPGQKNLKDYFKKVISDNRMPHALLLVGDEGFGPLAFANGIAALLQCSNSTDFVACGECSSCIKSTQFIHPDIHFSFPVVKLDKLKREDTTSKNFLPQWRTFLQNNIFGDLNDWLNHINASDKGANMNVTECNSIIKNLSLKTYEGKYKIQIIWHSELLGKEGNRLLKLIEEPTPESIIILTCSNRNAILNTIRSRCQIVNVPPIDDDNIGKYLEEKFSITGDQVNEIKYLATGNLRTAIQIASRSQMNYSEDMLNWFRYAYKADPDELNQWIAHLSSMSKQDLKTFMRYTLHFLREYLLGMNMKETSTLRLSNEEKNVILKMQKIINRAKTEQLSFLFSKNIGYISRNLSIKILLMNMTLEINEILRSEINKFV